MARRPSNLRIDDPAWPLLQALISYWGVTDAAGGGGGVTLLCGDLVNQPDFDGNEVVVISGAYGGQARDINGITTGGVVTPHLAFGGVIPANTPFVILSLRLTPAEVAALTALVVALMAGLPSYGNSLYADANPAVGDDANPGTRLSPFLTIQAAVTAAAEYTNIICFDSRVGVLAVGFDENTQIAGVIIDTNYLTVIGGKLSGDRILGGHVPIANSIANADHIFSGAGIGVAICGFSGVLPDVNGDEEVINLTGEGAQVIDCNIINPIGTPGYRGIVLTGDDSHVRRCHVRVFNNDGIRLEAGLVPHIEKVVLGDCLTGIHLLNGVLGTIIEHPDVFGCTTGIQTEVGAIWTHICTPHFHNNTNDVNNLGGATNAVIDAHETSQIVAEQTIEQDHKDIYDRIGGASTEATYALPNDVAENAAFTIPALSPLVSRIFIMLDLSNLVQNADIRIRYDMHGDGAPFPIMETFNWTVGMDDIVYFREISGQRAITVTVQSIIAQGAIVDIDYEYVLG